MQEEGKNQIYYIPQKSWYNMLRPDYVIPSCMFQLSSKQVTKLIQSQQPSQILKLLDQQQHQLIKKKIKESPSKSLYPKVNGRTPKDLPLINRQITKPQDLIHILHSSEYILQNLHKNQRAQIILRDFIPEITHNNRIFWVFARSGYTLAIGQKFCDHIEQQPNEQQYAKIIDVVQQIMPAITLVCPKNPSNELNSFLVSLYISSTLTKITSINCYPPFPKNRFIIFTQAQLQKYHKQIEQSSIHKSQQQKYQPNQCVIPLIRTIKKQEDIKHYDMGQYLMGNQIADQDHLNQWKQFIKEANQKIQQ